MTQYSKFDRANVTRLRKELDGVLTRFGLETGLKLEIGNIRFSAGEVRTKLTVRTKHAIESGEVPETVKGITQAIADRFGLSLEPSDGKQLVGYNARAKKYPFIYKKMVSGARYKTDLTRAKAMFGKPVRVKLGSAI